jgi:hypothetical protein
LPASLLEILDGGPELVKRLYCHPQYNAVMREYGAILLRELEQDPEALDAFKDYLGLAGARLDETEREPITAALVIGGAFVAGVVLGYLAERGKGKGK